MGDMPVEADYSHEEAVVKPREPQLDRNKLLTICSMACHNGEYVPYPENKLPRPLEDASGRGSGFHEPEAWQGGDLVPGLPSSRRSVPS